VTSLPKTFCIPALREEHRLRVCEERMLRRILGPRREELVGDRSIVTYTL
jgi:hypothetical protein